jgi:RimJ/RimL family protein N-acetyltransferase
MYVAPEVRGRGVARALAAALIERAARVEGLDRLHLTVMAHNQAAVRLYLSLGFEVWGREPDAMRWEGASYDELSMTLRLPR